MRRALLVGVLSVACAISEQRHLPEPGLEPSVTVKAYWRDAAGEKHRVGGLLVSLLREETEVARGVSSTEEPLRFAGLEPGHYRLRLRGESLPPVDHDFELPGARRVTIRVDVEAIVAGAAGDTAMLDGALYVLGDAVTRLQGAGARASLESGP